MTGDRGPMIVAGVLAGMLIAFGIMPVLQHILPPGWWVSFTDGAKLELDQDTNCPRLVLQRTVIRDVAAVWSIQPFRLVDGEWNSAGFSERSGYLFYETTDPPEFAAPITFWRGDAPVNCQELEGTYRIQVIIQLDPPFFEPSPVQMLSTPITYENGNAF